MRVLKTKKEVFMLLTDLVIFAIVITGVLFATSLVDFKAAPTTEKKLNNIEAISTYVIGDYSKETDKNIANIKLKQDLKKKYNIDVFSAESSDISAKSVDATALYNKEDTYKVLEGLVGCFAKYPNDIFTEVQNKGYNVSIYLVDKFSNNNIALATRDSNNSFNIYISNTRLLEKAVHHEFYHILEYYMKLQFDINLLYKDWKNYNPDGFVYNENTSELDSKYVYNINSNEKGAYFVTIYSKSAEKEDRAEIFADMMLVKSSPIYYLTGEKIGLKARYISSVLDESFISINGSKQDIYWERFLKAAK